MLRSWRGSAVAGAAPANGWGRPRPVGGQGLFRLNTVFSVGFALDPSVEEQPMASTPETQSAPEEPVVEETLVEEVSIDGMCGVYWRRGGC